MTLTARSHSKPGAIQRMKHYTGRMHDDLFGSASTAAGETASHNVFFALVPDPSARDRTARTVEALRGRHAVQGRWVSPSRYHMTLHFIGMFSELPMQRIDAACRAAQALELPAFDLVLDRAGHFPRGIGWLGCAEASASLQGLWEELRKALSRQHVAVQGHPTFKPHVTVLRGASTPLPIEAIDAVTWPTREFVLIDSLLGGRNEYRTLGRWALQQQG